MYILMISRGVPSPHHPQWGCFEKDQAEALARLGHKVVVMCIDARFERHRGSLGLHHYSINGVEYYNQVVLPAQLFSRILGRERYWTSIKRKYYIRLAEKIIALHGRPDVIYSQFFTNTAFAVDIKEYLGIPLVAIEHLARFNEESLNPFDEKWARRAFDGSDTLIAVAGTLAASLKKWFGKECVVVHNMYGKEFETPPTPSAKPEGAPLIFVSAASLVYRKGFDAIIKAFALAKLPSEKWMLKIIGWGEEKENLENLIKENHLERNVMLLGKMDKPSIVKVLSESHVFALPSRNENFSVAVLEGLAMGLPVLATDCGGIRECLDDNNGIITPVDDIPAMADAIKQMVDNYDQYNRTAIIEDCKRRFSPESIAKKLTEVFENTINANV